MKTQVITICSWKHVDVWKLTSALLPEFIAADEYLVFVPENEIQKFKAITNPKITIRSQAELGKPYSKELRRRVSEEQNELRFGWYLQQFYKIEALIGSDADSLIIWDADCVPVKKISTFDSAGHPIYMISAFEYNPAYFDAIWRLTKLKRNQEFSFVIPGFPIPKSWVHEFQEFLSARNNGMEWFDAIMQTTDFALKSGFSETETLGTFVTNLHAGEWSTFKGVWERRGQKRFGYARNFTTTKVVKAAQKAGLDIVSFENWDVRGIRLVLRRLLEKWQRIRVGWISIE